MFNFRVGLLYSSSKIKLELVFSKALDTVPLLVFSASREGENGDKNTHAIVPIAIVTRA